MLAGGLCRDFITAEWQNGIGSMRKLIFVISLLLAGCNNSTPTPAPNQWVCFHCSGMSVSGNGSFTFPDINGAVGYIYTAPSGNPAGKTITMTYTVSGSGTVLPSAASGSGAAQVRLFLWRKNDDMQCTAITEWYRQWSTTGAGPLTAGQHTISAVVSDPGWTDCFGRSDAGQLSSAAANLLGIGFTFGAEFYGHGVYSTGSNSFTLNGFKVQ